jgi:hypothetical protein
LTKYDYSSNFSKHHTTNLVEGRLEMFLTVRPAIASHLDHAKRVRGMLGAEGAGK